MRKVVMLGETVKFVAFFAVCCGTLPVTRKYPTKALGFMTKFGYLEQSDGDVQALYSSEGLTEVVKTMQKFGNVPQTGILDNATLQLLDKRRCGLPDIVRPETKRVKRFVLSRTSWKKRHLTFYLANWSPQLGEETVAKDIQLALNTWGKYGQLSFSRSPSPQADIIVAFGQGYHGDPYPFDGLGTVLAHAFSPGEEIGGDIHFDAEEIWGDVRSGKAPEDATDFYTVALHELGHSLGLSHSSEKSIMNPYYSGPVQSELEHDDILAMYQLYIARRLPEDDYTTRRTIITSTTTRPTPPRRRRPIRPTYNNIPPTKVTTTTKRPHYNNPTSSTEKTMISYHNDSETVEVHKKHEKGEIPDICNGFLDAVATLRGELFVFKDQYIWRLRDQRQILPGYPVKIHHMFPQLPENLTRIDAAYQRPDGYIILFTGKTYWVFDGHSFVENSPRPLTQLGLPEVLDSIDAVQIWTRNSKTYFYKGSLFWRYNEEKKEMEPGYPRDISKWRRIPEYLDAATTWKDGRTYFFKGELFWSFDNDWIIASEQSPMPLGQVWFGCPETSRMRKIFE